MRNKKTLWLAVGLAVTALLTGTACSLSPVFFSEKQVFAYVRLVYGTGYILTGIDHDGEEDGDRYYTFENRDGFSFTVTSRLRSGGARSPRHDHRPGLRHANSR